MCACHNVEWMFVFMPNHHPPSFQFNYVTSTTLSNSNPQPLPHLHQRIQMDLPLWSLSTYISIKLSKYLHMLRNKKKSIKIFEPVILLCVMQNLLINMKEASLYHLTKFDHMLLKCFKKKI